ncbi:hypothetical protein B0H67DRAFT_648583 [Lasiosphaeris hirsuta]|uniref:Uncharacterized protein n=1 Tax=Lasiosphaeris hirsuta TaxID=260670 RepID=A0AA40DPC0_9PEZI|nr:hypothetical protein B0H67DRAFT_648583 [Lasiosphaeris hirsuta]
MPILKSRPSILKNIIRSRSKSPSRKVRKRQSGPSSHAIELDMIGEASVQFFEKAGDWFKNPYRRRTSSTSASRLRTPTPYPRREMRYAEDEEEEEERSLPPLPSFLGNYATFEDNGRVLVTRARSLRLEDDEKPGEMLPMPTSMLFPTCHNPKGKGKAAQPNPAGDDGDAASYNDAASVSASTSTSSWDHASAMADFENDNPVRLQCSDRRTVTIVPPSPEVAEPCVAHIEHPNGSVLYHTPVRGSSHSAISASPSSSSNDAEWVTPPQTRDPDPDTGETGSVIYDDGNLVNALLIINAPTQQPLLAQATASTPPASSPRQNITTHLQLDHPDPTAPPHHLNNTTPPYHTPPSGQRPPSLRPSPPATTSHHPSPAPPTPLAQTPPPPPAERTGLRALTTPPPPGTSSRSVSMPAGGSGSGSGAGAGASSGLVRGGVRGSSARKRSVREMISAMETQRREAHARAGREVPGTVKWKGKGIAM